MKRRWLAAVGAVCLSGVGACQSSGPEAPTSDAQAPSSSSGGSSSGSSSGSGSSSSSSGGDASTGSSSGQDAAADASTGASDGAREAAADAAPDVGTPGSCAFGAGTASLMGANGNGEFTCYFFNMASHKTACGYTGTEMGSGSMGQCNQNVADTLPNVAATAPSGSSVKVSPTYFAAFPGPNSMSFDMTVCGACVEINGMNGTKIIATIADECPEDSNSICMGNPTGELDLSMAAFDALGFANGNPHGTTWKFVPCPVTGTIKALFNGANQVYFQNMTYPIKSVSGATPTSYGAWDFGGPAGGRTVTLTPASGDPIQVTIPGSDGDTGGQFAAPQAGSCY